MIKKSLLHLLIVIAFFAIPLSTHQARAASRIWYVDQSTPGSLRDGTSWMSAFTDLQAGLTVAITGDSIWVAQGIYLPGINRGDTFQFKNGVQIYGGFSTGGGDGTFEARNWATHATTLNGCIGSTGNSDNSYHVVDASNTNATAILV
jgi:autotransporter family porin